MDLFETLHTCCEHIENCAYGFLVELELILTELQPFELSNFRQLFAGYGVRVINSSYSFQWISLKPCILVVDILKMCMRIFADEKIIFDKIMAFWT